VAALAPPRAAAAAWRALRPRFSLDELEHGSFEVLPLVHRNLTLAGGDDPLLPRLKGIRRKTWVANRLLLERTGQAGATLREAGIPALFVDGVTVAVRFYPELGLRPTSFLSVLVDDRHAARALARLADAGWLVRPGAASGPGEIGQLVDTSGNTLALRTRLAVDFVRRRPGEPGRAVALWGTAEHLDVGGVDLLVLSRTEALAAACIAHVRPGAGSRTQWIVDAKMLLGAEVDWQRLVALASEHGQAARLRDALRYLASLPGPTPPGDVVARLGAVRMTPRERVSYRCTSGSIRGLGALPHYVAEHLAATAQEPPLRVVATFPRHLRDRWRLARTWHVPFAAIKRGARVLRTREGRAS